jgi:hypothetical protein
VRGRGGMWEEVIEGAGACVVRGFLLSFTRFSTLPGV